MSWNRSGVVCGMSRFHVIIPARLRQCEKTRKMRKSAVSEIAGSSPLAQNPVQCDYLQICANGFSNCVDFRQLLDFCSIVTQCHALIT